MIYLVNFLASLVFIFLKAAQQRNVAFDNYAWVIPTSVLMAAVEVIVITNVARQGWHLPLVLSVGLGAGIGAVLAMLFHKKVVMRK